MNINVDELVSRDGVSGKIYTNPAVFDLELKQIFEKTWVYVAHESEISNPGDYKTTDVGKHPVIVTRGSDDGQFHVMLNRCRHKAASVCQSECGNANFFRCAYHGWTYSNNGELIGMPFQDGYDKEFDKQHNGLIKLPRVDSYNGFIFASFNEEVCSLNDHLGYAKEYIDHIVNSGPEGIELSAGAHKYSYNANWKLQVENTIDPYHLSVTHRSFFNILSKKTGKKFNFNKIHNNEKISDLGNGHSLYELDGDLGIGALPFNLIIFPNLSFVGSHVRVVHPVSTDKTNVKLYPFLLKGKSDEVNAERIRKHEGFYGPAAFGTADDIEVGFDRVREGLNADIKNDWLLMSRGIDRETVDERGVITATSSDEVSARALYKQWKKLMTVETR
ncbi:aromatic ring-hydroxylating oxygenase subunit alpha [Domibacillus epiphyticus]|uniref:Rieske domain-containing protein n=1 Tax=Domibacillus epiphyticus TaxID=1714355 RepID=A0A1V2A8F9_9BACI|nr:Rieske 2Fe-2S domain-containing protein [Domibacillus epiphyticus]OMP67273.1 hypothetical protein BTO28_08070 [Domibacillus epiphyticus]